jgi:hypothetical protein
LGTCMNIQKNQGRSPCAFNIERLEHRRLLSAGNPDLSYGFKGVADASYTASRLDDATAISVLADGRFVVAGISETSPAGSIQTTDMAVARFLADGTPDQTFDHDGKSMLRLGLPSRATSVIGLANGKTLVGGDVLGRRTPESFDPPPVASIVRLNANGSFDRSFGGSGHVELRKFGPVSRLAGLAEGASGKV